MEEKMIIEGVKLLFIEVKDKDFGSSIVVDATDEGVQTKIEEYCAANGYIPKFKEFEKDGKKTLQFSVKLSQYVKVQDEEGNEWTLDDIEKNRRSIKLGFGAIISFVASTYKYNNKFGEGVSLAVSAIKIKKGADIKDDMSLLA